MVSWTEGLIRDIVNLLSTVDQVSALPTLLGLFRSSRWSNGRGDVVVCGEDAVSF